MKDTEKVLKVILFSSKPADKMIDPHVHHVAPEREPDYAAMQRFIRESADLIVKKKEQ